MKYCFPYPWRFSSWDFCGIFDSMSKLSGDLLFFFFFLDGKEIFKKTESGNHGIEKKSRDERLRKYLFLE